MRPPRDSRGFTVVELVLAIVIIGIAVAGVLRPMIRTAGLSADPAVRQQAVAIAEAYLEEILLRAFDETAVPNTADVEGGWGPDASETGRALYDDVNDYAVLGPQAPQDQDGNVVPALSAYTVEVLVQDTTLNGVAAARVAVRVRHGDGTDITLSGYRTSY